MIKISFVKDCNSKTGVCYSQRIRATEQDITNISRILQKDYEKTKRIQQEKNIYTSVEMRRIAYQKPLAETDCELTKNCCTKYFLNLTQLESILEYVCLKDNRVLYTNTVLLFDANKSKRRI